jgi:hypothetical protein
MKTTTLMISLKRDFSLLITDGPVVVTYCIAKQCDGLRYS